MMTVLTESMFAHMQIQGHPALKLQCHDLTLLWQASAKHGMKVHTLVQHQRLHIQQIPCQTALIEYVSSSKPVSRAQYILVLSVICCISWQSAAQAALSQVAIAALLLHHLQCTVVMII